jgi:hypothetical protein
VEISKISDLEDIVMGEEIAECGEGAVHQAKWLTTPVAIKLIRGRFNSEILTECKTLQ